MSHGPSYHVLFMVTYYKCVVFFFIIPHFFHSISIRVKKQGNKKAFGGMQKAAESLPEAYISEVIILRCNGKKQK